MRSTVQGFSSRSRLVRKRPEVVYDLDFRPGQLSIVLTRFLKSAWKVFWREQFDQVEKVEVPVEIGPWVELADSVKGAAALVPSEFAVV